MELEKIGVTQTENSSNENGPRTSKLHKQDVLSFARLGFLLFSLYSSFSLFSVPLGLAPTHNWYLKVCFFLLFISLATFGSG